MSGGRGSWLSILVKSTTPINSLRASRLKLTCDQSSGSQGHTQMKRSRSRYKRTRSKAWGAHRNCSPPRLRICIGQKSGYLSQSFPYSSMSSLRLAIAESASKSAGEHACGRQVQRLDKFVDG